MKFEFQFESLLNIRRHEEKKEQQELGRLLEKKVKLENQISTCTSQLNAFERAVSGSEIQTASDIRQRYELMQDQQKKIWRMKRDYTRLAEKIKHQRTKLLEANKKTQMLEKLEKRERTKFLELYQRREQKQQNEIATQMYNRTGQYEF